MSADVAQSLKNFEFFGINYPKGVYPVKRFFFTKFGLGEDVQGSHPRAKLCHCRLYQKFIPLFNLYKILPVGGRPRTTIPRQI